MTMELQQEVFIITLPRTHSFCKRSDLLPLRAFTPPSGGELINLQCLGIGGGDKNKEPPEESGGLHH